MIARCLLTTVSWRFVCVCAFGHCSAKTLSGARNCVIANERARRWMDGRMGGQTCKSYWHKLQIFLATYMCMFVCACTCVCACSFGTPSHAPECQSASRPVHWPWHLKMRNQHHLSHAHTHTSTHTHTYTWEVEKSVEIEIKNDTSADTAQQLKMKQNNFALQKACSLWHSWRRRCRVAFKNEKKKQKKMEI